MRYSLSYLILFIGLILSSCSGRPKGVVSDEKMVKIMADMDMADAYLQTNRNSYSNPEIREQLMNDILRRNKISRADFDSTMSWYGRHMDVYDELFKKVDRELARREKSMSGKEDTPSNLNDIWPYSRFATLNPISSGLGMVFNLPTDKVEKGEKIVWKFRSSNNITGMVLLGVKYNDGSYSYTNQTLGQRTMELSLQTDSSLTVKEVYGNIRPSDSYIRVSLDSISLVALPLDTLVYHNQYSQRKYMGPRRKSEIQAKKDTLSNSNNADTKRLHESNNDVLQLIQ